MDTEPKGRRRRPPRPPPTARGALPPSGSPASQPSSARPPKSRIACISGPAKGVGKTTVALNLALAWAGTQSRNVLIVQLDPSRSRELESLLGILKPPSLASLSAPEEHDAGALTQRLRGRIPISQWGVGVLPLGAERPGAPKLRSDAVVAVLAALAQSYDLFLDAGPFFPLQTLAYGLADMIFWIALPLQPHLEIARGHLEAIKMLRFPSERLEIVINEADLPGACAPKEIDAFLETKGKRVLSYMPRESLLADFAHDGRICVVERPQSPWASRLRPLLGRLMFES